MVNNNYNFGLITGIYHLKFSIVNGSLNNVPSNPYVQIILNGTNLNIYALQDISIAFSQNCFNNKYTPTVLGLQVNPTYISKTNSSFSTNGDACDLTVWRALEKGYGLQIDLNNSSATFNIELLIN